MEEENQALINRRHSFLSGDVVGHEMAFHEEMINTAWAIFVVDREVVGEASPAASTIEVCDDISADDFSGGSSGSGDCVSEEGLVLTAGHVTLSDNDMEAVEECDDISVEDFSGGSSGEASPARIVEECDDIISVENFGGGSSGCGVCVSEKGLVLTANHVTLFNNDNQKLVGSPYSDLSKVYDLDVVCRDPRADLAFVAPTDGGNAFHYASLAPNGDLNCGVNMYCILCKPQVLDFAMVSGFISYRALWHTDETGEEDDEEDDEEDGEEDDDEEGEALHHRLSIPSFGMQGMSGSPAFDCYGRITGIVGGIIGQDPLMAPIKCICKMIEDNRNTLEEYTIDQAE